MAVLSPKQFEQQYSSAINAGVSHSQAIKDISQATIKSNARAQQAQKQQEQPKTDKWQQTMDVIDNILGIKKPSVQPETMANASSSVSTGLTTNVSTGEKFGQPATELMPKTEDELRSELAELQSQIDREIALSGLATSAEQGAEQGQKIQSLREREIQLKSQLGETTARDRVSNFLSGLLKSNAAAATGGQRLLYEAGQGARSWVNEDLYSVAKNEYERALRAYNETVAEFGEENAWVEKNVLDAAKTKLDAFGAADEAQKGAAEEAADFANALQYGSQQDYEATKEGLGAVGRFAIDTGAAAGDILIDAATGVPMVNMAARAFGNAAIEADNAGATIDKQLEYAAAQAGKGAILNKLVGGLGKVYGKSKLSSVTDKLWDKAAKNPATANALKAVLNTEGAEEFLEAAIDPAMRTIYSDKSLAEEYSEEELADWLYSGLVGQILGAGFTGLEVATEGRNAAPQTQPQTQPQSEAAQEGNIPATPTAPNASTNAPDVLNSNIQPQSAADIVVEAAMGQQTAPEQQNNAPAGANGAPQSNLGGGTRTSQSTETVANSAITNDARRAELEPFVANGRFDYIPDTNAKQTERATRTIMKDGWKKASEDFKADVAAGKSGKDLVARGAVLLNNLSNSEASASEYMDMVDSYIELMHRAGETLQAGKIVQQLTPEGRLYLILKTQDKINRNLTNSQRAKAGKAQGVEAQDVKIQIAPELIDRYRAAQTDAERDGIISEMQQNMAEQIPATLEEKLNAWRYTAMLGNFKTQIRNVTGNALSVTAKVLKDRLAAVGEMIAEASGADIERTRSFVVSPELYKAAWNDFPANREAALGEQKYSAARQQIERDVNDKRRVFDNKILEKWRTTTQDAMQAGDALFARIAYADALGGWLQAHGINFETATEEQLTRARAFAAKEAQEATFRDKNQFSDMITSLGSGWRHSDKAVAKAASTVLEGVVPFRKTPANVLVRAEEYSPLGVANTILKATKAAKGEAEINEVINSAAKTATGSALAAVGYFLAAAGRLRGMEDDEELDKAQKAAGAMDWSFITKDGKYVALNQFAPMTVPLFMGVRLAELTQGQDIEPKDIFKIIKGTTAPMLEMSMLSGLDNAFSDLSKYGDDSSAFGQVIQNALMSYVQQYIPAIVGQLEQAAEKYRQTTYTNKENPWLDTDTQYAFGKASARVPGWDYQQIDYIDMWGRKTEQGDGVERFVNAVFNPTYTSKSKAEAMDTELERLHTAVKDLEGAASVYPSFVSRSTKLDKSGKTMTQEQYQQYKIDMGSKSRELAKDFVESPEYKKLSDEQRAKVLSQLYNLASSQALKTAKSSQGITGDALKTDWDMEATLSDPAKFLAETAIAKGKAEKKGETFSTRGADALAYFATKGFADSDMDILADDMLGDRQAAVYDTMRAAGTSAKDTVSWYMSLDVNNSNVISQDEIGPVLKGRDDLTDEQKAIIWANTQTGKTDWATWLAKHG